MPMKPYYVKLRELREGQDLKQSDVALVLGTTQQVYSRYENGINDLYPSEYITFYVCDFVVQISNEKLGKALEKLSNRQINVILLFYFLGFSDIEIAKLHQCSRSSVYRSRKKALNILKIQMKGKQE